jgi:hypothetical protein
MLSFDMLSFDVLSFDVLSFDMLSFDVLSFEMLSFDMPAYLVNSHWVAHELPFLITNDSTPHSSASFLGLLTPFFTIPLSGRLSST